MRDQLTAAHRRPGGTLGPGRPRPPAADRKGFTQTDLAGDRFSKEYVSQIERGKTRPTDETTEWLAARLGVDRGSSRPECPRASASASKGARARRSRPRIEPVRGGDRRIVSLARDRWVAARAPVPRLPLKSGPHEHRRGARSDRAPRVRPPAGREPRRSATSIAPRCSSGWASAATSLPPSPARSRSCRKRSTCGAVGPPCRSAAFERPRLALTLLPAPA